MYGFLASPILDSSPVLKNCGREYLYRRSLYHGNCNILTLVPCIFCRSQWPRGLRRKSAAARLLRLWVRIPPGAWIFVCSECRVLSGLCDELITRPEESCRLWCVVVCDLETSWMRTPWPTGGCCAQKKKQTNRASFTILYNDQPTNVKVTGKLLYCSYLFRHYCIILWELIVSSLLSYISISMQ